MSKPLTIDELIDHLTTLRAQDPERVGKMPVYMVPDDDTMVPAVTPIIISSELCIYAETLF